MKTTTTAALTVSFLATTAICAPNDTTPTVGSPAVKPTHYAMAVFPAFQALDVFGPLDVLNMLSISYPGLQLSILADTLESVSTKPVSMANTWGGERIVPTHTFETAPIDDIDVLIVPGGIGTRNLNFTEGTRNFVNKWIATGSDYLGEADSSARQRYLISICTGAGVLAKAGALDNRHATGNKRSWAWVTSQSNHVQWVPKARWVADGNVWSSSGIAAGIDAMYAFVAHIYNETVAASLADGVEYERHTDPSWDPFSDLYNLTTPVYVPTTETSPVEKYRKRMINIHGRTVIV